MVQQSLDRGDEVVGVCRQQSVGKLDAFKGRIRVIPGATDDREVIKRAVAGVIVMASPCKRIETVMNVAPRQVPFRLRVRLGMATSWAIRKSPRSSSRSTSAPSSRLPDIPRGRRST